MRCSGSPELVDTAERVLFGLVANRALAPSSKLAAARWISEDAAIAGLAGTSDDACYRAMDWLLEVEDELEREVFSQVANLLNLEVDLLFFDTASTYFEIDGEDEPVWRDKHGEPAPGGVDEDPAVAADQDGKLAAFRASNRIPADYRTTSAAEPQIERHAETGKVPGFVPVSRRNLASAQPCPVPGEPGSACR